jgi:hypothetical protein
MLEADFFSSFQLYHPAAVDHQFDRPIADGPQRIHQLPKEQGRQGNRALVAGVQAGRQGRVSSQP